MKKYIFLFLISIFIFSVSEAHVGLVYPSGGESFNPGETITIEWEILVNHNTLNWDLYFSDDGGISWESIQLDIPLENLTYEWLVPEMPTTQGRIRIVMDNDGTNYEDISGDFTITSPVGVSDLHTIPEIKVYPNPASSEVNISVKGFDFDEVSIYFLTGQQVLNIRPENSKLDISKLNAGIYIIEVQVNNLRFREKLIIQ